MRERLIIVLQLLLGVAGIVALLLIAKLADTMTLWDQ